MSKNQLSIDKKLGYRRGTVWRAVTCYASKFVLCFTCYGVIKIPNSKSDLKGHPRALAMVPFDRPHMISYQSSIATIMLW